MAPIKSYEMVTTNLKRTKAELRDTRNGAAMYQLDMSFALRDLRASKPGRHAIVLQTPSPSNQVLGTCDFTFGSLSTPIHLGFGDPVTSPDTVVWEHIYIREIVRQSDFEIGVDLGGDIGRKTFYWKRTTAVENKSSLSQQMDWLHLKMVERDTGIVVAKFVHNFMFGRKRGTWEIQEFEGGSDWDRVVLLSGLAVLEYMRKSWGYSW